MKRYFTAEQIGAIADLLVKFRKSRQNWDDWRKLNWSDAIADKWLACLKEIRLNGYIGPEVINGQIVFYQVLRMPRTDEGNRCSVCMNRLDKGECMGTKATQTRQIKQDEKTITIVRGDFIPCWLLKKGNLRNGE